MKIIDFVWRYTNLVEYYIPFCRKLIWISTQLSHWGLNADIIWIDMIGREAA